MNESMNEWMNEWMNKWIYELACIAADREGFGPSTGKRSACPQPLGFCVAVYCRYRVAYPISANQNKQSDESPTERSTLIIIENSSLKQIILLKQTTKII